MASFNNLILIGGISHNFGSAAAALADVLSPLGIASQMEEDMEAGLLSLATRPPDLLTIYALRWEMLGEKYDPYRDTEAYSPSPQARQALSNFVLNGGALLGMHTACICFSDWPQWGELLGGKWVWGQSWHPPLETVSVSPEPTSKNSELTSFAVTDELYTCLAVSTDVTVMAVAHSDAVPEPQPVMWRYKPGRGRVVFDSLGHDSRSVSETTHARLIRDSVDWLLPELANG